MNTIDKVAKVFQWLDERNPGGNYFGNTADAKKIDENTFTYYDIEDHYCVLTFVRNTIQLNGKKYTFMEFLYLLLGKEEDDLELIEEMLLDLIK